MEMGNVIAYIEDIEWIYRRVEKNTPELTGKGKRYVYHSQDNIEVQSPAFNGTCPSVDLESLTNYNPVKTQRHRDNGVLKFAVGAVREFDIDYNNISIDVKHKPEDGNWAHSEIIVVENGIKLSCKQKARARQYLRHALADFVDETHWVEKPVYPS
ncbi:MAG: hypothetical protein OXN27_06895 [Candidatus Poribacteria bacterium]|nr:hypothetical protein [Candidatus Poribacteria bacterium]